MVDHVITFWKSKAKSFSFPCVTCIKKCSRLKTNFEKLWNLSFLTIDLRKKKKKKLPNFVQQNPQVFYVD